MDRPEPPPWPRARRNGRARFHRLVGLLLALALVVLALVVSGALALGPTDAALARREATEIHPDPAEAEADVPFPQDQGCMIGIEIERSGRCLYGDPRGRRTLILFGDSHALQVFPALEVVARRDHWRLVVLTKRECTPATVTVFNSLAGGAYAECDAWRRNELRRIEQRGGRPVVAIGGKAEYTAYGPYGEELDGRANAKALEAGYVATLRRVERAGLRPVVIRDTPKPPFDVPECVLAHLADVGACDFAERDRRWRDFDVRAARRVGARLIDPGEKICPHGLCRAVVGDVLVYRDPAHLTATYARTLASWFEPRLRAAFAAAGRHR